MWHVVKRLRTHIEDIQMTDIVDIYLETGDFHEIKERRFILIDKRSVSDECII